MSRDYLALARRIRGALLDLEHVAQRAEQLCNKARQTGDDGYWDGVALNLHGFYEGVEQLLETLAQAIEGSLPSGPQWHRDLLIQMSKEVPGARPAVIAEDTFQCLENYRTFRHVVRNVYSFYLRPDRLQELVNALQSCSEAVKHDLTRFADFLEKSAQLEDPPLD